MTDVALVDELLWIVSCPVAAPAAAGSNCTSSVTAMPGFKVTGNVTPDIVKPVPLSVPELMVTGPVPLEVNVTGCVDAVFTATLPNATLVGLLVNVGTVGTAAFSCRAKLLETPSAFAVSVTACADVTDDTLAANPALVAFAGTTTVAGTVTSGLLLARFTLRPPAEAAVSVTVQGSLPDPVMNALLQESALNAAGPAVPVPVGLFTAVPQPNGGRVMRKHANIANSFVHGPSSLGIEPRL
jgi:hypothetical protein